MEGEREGEGEAEGKGKSLADGPPAVLRGVGGWSDMVRCTMLEMAIVAWW